MEQFHGMGKISKIPQNNMKKILVICSGGLDSIATAILALQQPNVEVSLISFDYGQKATRELESARNLAAKYNLQHIIQDISPLKFIFGKTQLTDEETKVEGEYRQSVVVPLRNAMFLQVAMIYAYAHDFDEVMLGSHLDDCQEVNGERLFPDCSPEFFSAYELAMRLGVFRKQKKVHIVTPSLLGMGKTDLIRAAHKLDPMSIYGSWSCYKNGAQQCGECDSCKNRKKAFEAAGVWDGTGYEK